MNWPPSTEDQTDLPQLEDGFGPIHSLSVLRTALFVLAITGPPLSAAETLLSDITDLVLVTGQSNVTASQTDYDPQLDSGDLRVFAYTSNNDWEIADLHQAWDLDGWHPGNGSIQTPSRTPYNSFAFHFAKEVVQSDPNRVVGLIIAGAPGKGISHWDVNSDFSQIIDAKVLRALNAQGIKSQIDGILWHQGETDWQFTGTSDPEVPATERSNPRYYPEKLDALISNFRVKSWFSTDKPFICGETKQAPVNDRLLALNNDSDSWTGCVLASDLATREMNLSANPPVLGTHFNAYALRTLGSRYAKLYIEMTTSSPNGTTEDTIAPVAEITTPTHYSSITPGLISVSGTSSDSESEVESIVLRIEKLDTSPRQSWNGSQWTTQKSNVNAIVSNGGSYWTLANVNFSDLGKYMIRVRARDSSGNTSNFGINPKSIFSVVGNNTNDITAPVAEVTSPANSSSVFSGFIDLSGTTSDLESEVESIVLRIERLDTSPRQFWDGSQWTTQNSNVNAIVDTGRLSWTFTDVNFNNPGIYMVRVRAVDSSGNGSNFGSNSRSIFTVVTGN